MKDPAARLVRFGVFEVDLRSGELRKAGRRIALQEQPFRILVRLLERPHDVVTREELRRELWPADTFVDFEQGLNAAVKRLREALGDGADSPRFIETLPRRGYRFVAPVEEIPPTGTASRLVPARRPFWLAMTVVFVIAAALSLPDVAQRRPDTAIRFTLDVEQSGLHSAANSAEGLLALCPDGSCVVYRGAQEGIGRLFLRFFDRLDTLALPGTEGAHGPFFSPDGRWLGFFAGGRLKKLSIDRLIVEDLCEAPNGRGATWAPDNRIFAALKEHGPISQISAVDGSTVVVTNLDQRDGDVSHRWPMVVPQRRVLLYEVLDASGHSRIVSQSLVNGERAVLVDGGRYPRLAGREHLLFVMDNGLNAAAFDARTVRLTSKPTELIHPSNGKMAGRFDVTANGTLAYARVVWQQDDSTLWRVERSGRATAVSDMRAAFAYPRFSPEGDKVALTITNASGRSDIWTYDLKRRSLTRVSFGEGSHEGAIWAPDGRSLVYRSARAGTFELVRQPLDGTGSTERLFTSRLEVFPGSWSPDGGIVSFLNVHPVTSADLWVLPIANKDSARPFISTSFGEWDGLFSPDGRLFAYTSMESGRFEVYVRTYPGPGDRRQVSTDGGNSPLWARNGRELFYLNGPKMMAVSIRSGPEPEIGTPQLLFEAEYQFAGYLANFDVTPDGQAFVMVRGKQSKPWMHVDVVLDWFQELKRRAPANIEAVITR